MSGPNEFAVIALFVRALTLIVRNYHTILVALLGVIFLSAVATILQTVIPALVAFGLSCLITLVLGGLTIYLIRKH